MSNLEDYRVLAGDVFFRFWSSVVRSSNSNVNLGVWSPTIRRMPRLKLVEEVEPRIVANRRTLMGHLQDSERCEVLASKWNKVWQRVFFLLQGLMDRRVVCNAPSWSMADLPCSFCRSAMIQA